MTESPRWFEDADALADAVVRQVGTSIVLALPLGLGKANHVANALYARAEGDPSIKLTIFTALTLEKPEPENELERRFITPVIERLFGGYPELSYAKALRQDTLPPNINVSEFFFLAGRWLRVPAAQQSFIAANYTHAGRYVLERGVNVIAQLVARRDVNGDPRFSLSCNTDITLDLLRARAEGNAHFMLVGQVNSELPFMPGEGDLPAGAFSHLLEGPRNEFPLFAPPTEPVSLAEYATGLHVARLVPDGGTLQIGIGQEGDATAHCLILRHRENAVFKQAVSRLAPNAERSSLDHDGPFDVGLHGVSEMFVASFLALIRAGVLKRDVDGVLMHAAFFIGPKAFYRALREMSDAELSRLQMTAVSFTNELYGDEVRKRQARTKARFINSTMMATLLGAVVSDGLEDGRAVSGVGGQYNFVSQAFALEDARSIITLNSTRETRGRLESNIRWSYGHETIPSHLRDIIVSEYGVADIRGKTDREVVAAMLSIADSRFQPELLRQAKDAGKIPRTFEIASARRENVSERIERALKPIRDRGALPLFPFGTDFSETERSLIPALQFLKTASASPWRMARLALEGSFAGGRSEKAAAGLTRMGLADSKGLRDRLYAALLRAALSRTTTSESIAKGRPARDGSL